MELSFKEQSWMARFKAEKITSILCCQIEAVVESKIWEGEQISGWGIVPRNILYYLHFPSKNLLCKPLAWIKGYSISLSGGFPGQSNKSKLSFPLPPSLPPSLLFPAQVPWNGVVIARSPQLQQSCYVTSLGVQTWDFILVLQPPILHVSLSGSLVLSASLRICTCEWAAWNEHAVWCIRSTQRYFIKNKNAQISRPHFQRSWFRKVKEELIFEPLLFTQGTYP